MKNALSAHEQTPSERAAAAVVQTNMAAAGKQLFESKATAQKISRYIAKQKVNGRKVGSAQAARELELLGEL